MEKEEEAEEPILSLKRATNMMKENFLAFAKLDEPIEENRISLDNIYVWFKRAAVPEDEEFMGDSVAAIFESEAGHATRLKFENFNRLIDRVSEDLKEDREYLVKKLALCSVPRETISPECATHMMEENFSAFANFDDPEGKDGISLRNMKMWFARAALLEPDEFDAVELDASFNRLAEKNHRLAFDYFNNFLTSFSEKKDVPKEDVVKQLALATVPSEKATTSPKNARNMMELTFSAFSKFYRQEKLDGISLPIIKTWFLRAALLEVEGLSAEEIEEAFEKVAMKHSLLSFDAFNIFLDRLSKVTIDDVEYLVKKLAIATVPFDNDETSAGVSLVLLEKHFWAFAKMDDRMERRGIKLSSIKVWFKRADVMNGYGAIVSKILEEAYEEVDGIHRKFDRLTFHGFQTLLDIFAQNGGIGRPGMEEKLIAATLPGADTSSEVGAGSTGSSSSSEEESDCSSVTIYICLDLRIIIISLVRWSRS